MFSIDNRRQARSTRRILKAWGMEMSHSACRRHAIRLDINSIDGDTCFSTGEKRCPLSYTDRGGRKEMSPVFHRWRRAKKEPPGLTGGFYMPELNTSSGNANNCSFNNTQDMSGLRFLYRTACHPVKRIFQNSPDRHPLQRHAHCMAR